MFISIFLNYRLNESVEIFFSYCFMLRSFELYMEALISFFSVFFALFVTKHPSSSFMVHHDILSFVRTDASRFSSVTQRILKRKISCLLNSLTDFYCIRQENLFWSYALTMFRKSLRRGRESFQCYNSHRNTKWTITMVPRTISVPVMICILVLIACFLCMLGYFHLWFACNKRHRKKYLAKNGGKEAQQERLDHEMSLPPTYTTTDGKIFEWTRRFTLNDESIL